MIIPDAGYALLDGHLEKVGAFRMEPPSLFRGRGTHPKTGTLKQRTQAEQVSINISQGSAPPICTQPGHAWGAVQHDNTVTWLASWHENVMQQTKYVMLAAVSSLKGKSDFAKFQKAQVLKGCIDKVRRDYRTGLKSTEEHAAQLATTMWLIDVYALRVGGEKGEDEADTVGCCSLRVEHFTFSKALFFLFKIGVERDAIYVFWSLILLEFWKGKSTGGWVDGGDAGVPGQGLDPLHADDRLCVLRRARQARLRQPQALLQGQEAPRTSL